MTIRSIPELPVVALKIDDYCEMRARVVDMVKRAYELIAEARELNEQQVPHGFPEISTRIDFADVRKSIDGCYWRHVLDRTGAAALMDAQARKEFREGLQHGDVPPFTMDNVTTHFLSMSQTAGAMFARGVYNIFRRYVRLGERGYETNKKQPFAIPRKLILDRWFSKAWGRIDKGHHVSYGSSDEVNDFGRVVNVLAGRPYVVRGLETELNAALHNTDTNTFENAILKIRAFDNGNAHCWIKDRVLLDRINQQIAIYCDGQLAEAHDPEYGKNEETTVAA